MKHLMTLICLAPLAALAMPSRADLEKVQPLVNEMMAEDVAAQKAGKMTSAQVAEHALGLVGKAESEAAKYLLLNGAFNNFANAHDFDRAAETLAKMRTVVSGFPPEMIVQQIQRVLTDRTAGGKLGEMLKAARLEMHYAGRLAKVREQLKGGTRTPALLREEADCLALTGQWPEALDAYAKLGAKEAAVVSFERDEQGDERALEVADFWWNYTCRGIAPDAISAFKVHAAPFYRMAIATGKVTGLRRSVVEKRLAQIEADVGRSASLHPQAKRVGPNVKAGLTRKFDLPGGVALELVACPAGTFTMGCKGDLRKNSPFREHRVTITRPFWIGKFPVTVGQLAALDLHRRKGKNEWWYKHAMEKFYGAQQAATAPCLEEDVIPRLLKRLNQDFASKRPRGYVFRLPTEAEWEYAFRANTTDPEDPYGWLWSSGDSERSLSNPQVASKLAFGFDDFERPGKWNELEAFIKTKGTGYNRYPFGPVGRRKPNAWGIHDLVGMPSRQLPVRSGDGEVVMDVLAYDGNNEWSAVVTRPWQYADEETDPLIFTPRKVSPCWRKDYAANLVLSTSRHKLLGQRARIRLVLGPDILTEKGYKQEE